MYEYVQTATGWVLCWGGAAPAPRADGRRPGPGGPGAAGRGCGRGRAVDGLGRLSNANPHSGGRRRAGHFSFQESLFCPFLLWPSIRLVSGPPRPPQPPGPRRARRDRPRPGRVRKTPRLEVGRRASVASPGFQRLPLPFPLLQPEETRRPVFRYVLASGDQHPGAQPIRLVGRGQPTDIPQAGGAVLAGGARQRPVPIHGASPR